MMSQLNFSSSTIRIVALFKLPYFGGFPEKLKFGFNLLCLADLEALGGGSSSETIVIYGKLGSQT